MAITPVRTAGDARAALRSLAGYQKVTSWLLLHALDIPTAAGLVITPDEAEFMPQAVEFARQSGWTALLVRSDARMETGVYPRGGFIAPLESIATALQPFAARLLFLLEPISPLDDLYSLGVNAWPGDDLVMEIVGPGFDASDLKRGDLTPHESWIVSRELTIRSRNLTDEQTYRSSWHRRLEKVHSLLEHQDAGIPTARPAETSERLRRSGHDLLLVAESGYVPIPEDLARSALQVAANLGMRLEKLGFDGEPFSVSMSYVGRGARPVWWDIVWPHTKYEGLRVT